MSEDWGLYYHHPVPLLNKELSLADLMQDSPLFSELSKDKFTFSHNMGTVTVRDRVSFHNADGSWTVNYQNPRTARIADDGTLVHYITNKRYFSYKNVMVFQNHQDNSQNILAVEPPVCLYNWL